MSKSPASATSSAILPVAWEPVIGQRIIHARFGGGIVIAGPDLTGRPDCFAIRFYAGNTMQGPADTLRADPRSFQVIAGGLPEQPRSVAGSKCQS